MATTQLSAAAGQLGGQATLASGTWYISIKTALMGPGNYSVSGSNVVGDPHITTTNGVHYDFQGAGEFVLLRKGSAFEVQSRMRPVATAGPAFDPHTGLQSCVSINTAAAIRVGDHRITYEPREPARGGAKGMELRIDGHLVSIRPGGLLQPGGFRVFQNSDSGEVRVVVANEDYVRVVPHWWPATRLWYLDFDMSPPAGSTGIVGPIAPDEWLPAMADGSPMGPRPAGLPERYKALYETFAQSWRVTDASSLFDYTPGTTSSTYSIKSWPRESGKCDIPSVAPLTGAPMDVAESACKALVAPPLKRVCIADVMVTGDPIFGKSYKQTQGKLKARSQAQALRK